MMKILYVEVTLEIYKEKTLDDCIAFINNAHDDRKYSSLQLLQIRKMSI